MSETLTKLRPDRDLQCYFERPSAIAALSNASASGFRLSGTWRQQFDWAVLEWNQHNVFEHPMFRNLPDGDLSGLQLTYDEVRTNCIPLDSDLYPTVDWPHLRIWARSDGVEDLYRVRLKDYAQPVEGTYVAATGQMTLEGILSPGDYIGISFLSEHFTYQAVQGDTLDSVAQQLVGSVNAFSTYLAASRVGSTVQLAYAGEGQSLATSTTGMNGNRLGAYGFVAGARTENWRPDSVRFSGGQSPNKWRVTLNFSTLLDVDGRPVPTTDVRKMRWTYCADLQDGSYQRGEFLVEVANWTVTGSRLEYRIAGPGSRRVEDDHTSLSYAGAWTPSIGNYSGGTIRSTSTRDATVAIPYGCPISHELFLGTRYLSEGAQIEAKVDGNLVKSESLDLPNEDVLIRLPLGSYGPGNHTVEVRHAGPVGQAFYFDFLEICIPATTTPNTGPEPMVTLATDWDTDHSIALPAERTAWLIHSLGFRGRANHYVGALWFYELYRKDHVYASARIEFSGTPEFSQTTEIRVGWLGEPSSSDAVITHVNRIGDTPEMLARSFALDLNRGFSAVRADASGTMLTVHARAMGTKGNDITLTVSPTTGAFHLIVSGTTLSGGVDGEWRTDVAASPRLNRAVRDWSRSYYVAMQSYGIDVVAAFSMELQHGDPDASGGMAQRYPSGAAVLLNTPAVQTNFSPTSRDFWKEVYGEMATIQAEAGQQPYLQFGEVQWWYFASEGSGMPFYDAYTTSRFQTTYGRPMAVIANHQADPTLYPDETAFLPRLVGEFTDAIVNHVRQSLPACRFEVLYPTDVNDSPLNALINYPTLSWTSGMLDNLKTESFTYTLQRNLDKSQGTILYGVARGFSRSTRSYLVGIGDSSTSWLKEVGQARAEGIESIVLFALDQFCLIGYAMPLKSNTSRALFQG